MSVWRTSYLLLRRDLILLRMGDKLQIDFGSCAWMRPGGTSAHVRSLWHIFNRLGDRMPHPSEASRIFFPDQRDLLLTSQSSCVSATPELCERPCAMRREVMRGFRAGSSSGHRLLRCRHSNQTLDHCEADMELDWTDDNLSFSCICLLSLMVEHPLNKREVVGSNLKGAFGCSIQIFVRWQRERRQLNMEGSRWRCRQFKNLLYRHCDLEARPCARPVDEVDGNRFACT